jgi:acetolactate synthase-1/2/3 large subunit
MAREGLNVTSVVFANGAYGVLQWEYSGLGVGAPGPRAADLFAIGRPDIDWVLMSKSMGVPATRATSLEMFGVLLRRSFATPGPALIEISL